MLNSLSLTLSTRDSRCATSTVTQAPEQTKASCLVMLYCCHLENLVVSGKGTPLFYFTPGSADYVACPT